jgi:hypothetical protein
MAAHLLEGAAQKEFFRVGCARQGSHAGTSEGTLHGCNERRDARTRIVAASSRTQNFAVERSGRLRLEQRDQREPCEAGNNVVSGRGFLE